MLAYAEKVNDPTFHFFSTAQEAQKLLDAIRLQLQTKVMQASIAETEEAQTTLQK